MWVPRSEGELIKAIEVGDLIETATFDAKAALPTRGRSKDLAIDVAAMANDGGTLLYGVAEDERGRPNILSPIELDGATERVDRIVRSCISEPPTIELHLIPTDDDPEVGYLVVAVPPSPRAPHMVTVGKDYRYYGRSATGNVLLTEGEVARLYERPRRWEIDREALLEEEISQAPLRPRADFAYLHLVARPVVSDEALFGKAADGQAPLQFLGGLFSSAKAAFSQPYSPDLPQLSNFDRVTDGWLWRTHQEIDPIQRQTDRPQYVLHFQVDLDGSGHLFCGRAAERRDGLLIIFEDIVAGLTTKFLSVLGSLYAAGSYLGPVDVGIAVTGLRGGTSNALQSHYRAVGSPRFFDKDLYRRTKRFLASQLKGDPRGCARELVLPLTRATTQELYDPFAQG